MLRITSLLTPTPEKGGWVGVTLIAIGILMLAWAAYLIITKELLLPWINSLLWLMNKASV